MVLFPIVFLTLLGVVGTEFLDLLVNFFFQNSAYDLGNSSLLILLKILVVFGLFGLATLNLLAKKEASIFASAQFIYIWCGSLLLNFSFYCKSRIKCVFRHIFG